MLSGDSQPTKRSTFASFFHREREDAQEQHSSSVWRSVIEEKYEEESVFPDNDGGDRAQRPGLDQEQKLSADVLNNPTSFPEAGPSMPARTSSPFPIPNSVSQASNMSSSPAALFLSSFMSPKAEPVPMEDDEGQSIAGYTLGSIIGFGGFSVIRKAFSASGGVVAIKIIRSLDLVRTGHAPVERKRLRHEAAVWSCLSHEHILPLFSAVHTSYADYFITLYCPAGSLYDILKRDGNPALLQDDVGMMFRQVVRGLRYLHEDAMFVHRDMKLENVLVDESGVCRIGDFGMSVKIGEVEEDDEPTREDQDHEHQHHPVHRAMSLSLPSHKRVGRVAGLGSVVRHNSARQRNSTSSPVSPRILQPGSLPYAAPELLLPHTSEVVSPHPSQDIWALGVMLYTLLTGHLPFNDSFEPRLQMKILNGAFELPQDIGRGAERILKGCLERTVTKRWSIAMVDEVAWGVGWGSAGDGATPEESTEDLLAHNQDNDADAAECYSHPTDDIIPELEDEDWQHEERVSRSAIQAASRRSSSRAQRSLSRAPIPTRTSRNPSRSRQSRPSSPPRSGRSRSMYYSESRSMSASVSVSHSPVATPLRSRSPSRRRGRAGRSNTGSYFPSRSRSPSVVPTTPIDFGAHLLSHLSLEDQPEEFELEPPPRGRSKFIPTFQPDRTSSSDRYFLGEGDETSQSSSDPSQSSGWSRSVTDASSEGKEHDHDHDEEERVGGIILSGQEFEGVERADRLSKRRSRPGSTPPAHAVSWERDVQRKPVAHGFGGRPSQDMFLGPLSPSGASATIISRSRSADCDPRGSATVGGMEPISPLPAS